MPQPLQYTDQGHGSSLSHCAATLTNELQFVIIETFVGQQLLQEGYDLHGAVLIGLGQIYVPQV